VKRGLRVVHGGKELIEKLGRNDLCPCGSGRRFQGLLPNLKELSSSAITTSAELGVDHGVTVAAVPQIDSRCPTITKRGGGVIGS